MAFLLRLVGAIWILLSAGTCLKVINGVLKRGIDYPWNLTDLLNIFMFAGGIGLLLLKEWGRWVLLVGSISFLLLLAGPSLIKFQVGPVVLRNLIFYGIFIAILAIPPAKAVTQ